MGKYEVTQEEYLTVTGRNPSWFNGVRQEWDPELNVLFEVDYGENLKRPVENVYQGDAASFCLMLTEMEQAAGRIPIGYVYRLPTEAEWEYACRAGTTTAFHYGSALLSGMANFCGIYGYDAFLGIITNESGIYLGTSVLVGSYSPNAWSLYDMHGNVWEWCSDFFGVYPGGQV